MNAADRRSARAALDVARPAVARVDGRMVGGDLAPDLVEIWTAIESALRAIVGGSSLAGQALIRAARQRQALTFEQANTLAAFQAVRDRLQRTTYVPTEDDVKWAREAYLALNAGLAEPEPLKPPTPAAAPAQARRRRPVWLTAVAAAFVVAAVAGASWAYKRLGPSDPLAHVYLARMAREAGDYPLTRHELELALQADARNEVVLREIGAYFLTIGNYDMARRSYVDAAKINPRDKTALGYLGCALSHLGRQQEATAFFDRAGQGAWSSCAGVVPR